jgi:hypothetical protein
MLMKRTTLCLLASLALWPMGCDNSEPAPVARPPAAPGTPTVTPPPADVDTPASDATPTIDPTVAPDPAVSGTTTTMPTTQPGADAAGDIATQARSLLTQVLDYIKAKKWNDADAALKKLEGMKDSLPQQLRTQIDSARSSLDGARKLDSASQGLGDIMK